MNTPGPPAWTRPGAAPWRISPPASFWTRKGCARLVLRWEPLVLWWEQPRPQLLQQPACRAELVAIPLGNSAAPRSVRGEGPSGASSALQVGAALVAFSANGGDGAFPVKPHRDTGIAGRASSPPLAEKATRAAPTVWSWCSVRTDGTCACPLAILACTPQRPKRARPRGAAVSIPSAGKKPKKTPGQARRSSCVLTRWGLDYSACTWSACMPF